MLSFSYLFFNIGAVIIALLLMKKFKIAFNFKAFAGSLIAVSLPFILWDSWAVSLGHWSFNADYITGIYIGNLAIEEILFFITIPFLMTAIYLIYVTRFKDKEINKIWPWTLQLALGFGLLASAESMSYTQFIAAAYLLSVVILWMSDDFTGKTFWRYQIVLISLFFLANTVLTAVPIIEYGESEILNYRLGTIPLEDFFYNFALFNLFNLTYSRLTAKL